MGAMFDYLDAEEGGAEDMIKHALGEVIELNDKIRGSPDGPELLASRIECQDQFLNATALYFILSLPDSQDFAAVHVVRTSLGKATEAQTILNFGGICYASLACPPHVSGRRL